MRDGERRGRSGSGGVKMVPLDARSCVDWIVLCSLLKNGSWYTTSEFDFVWAGRDGVIQGTCVASSSFRRVVWQARNKGSRESLSRLPRKLRVGPCVPTLNHSIITYGGSTRTFEIYQHITLILLITSHSTVRISKISFSLLLLRPPSTIHPSTLDPSPPPSPSSLSKLPPLSD